ncbi:hypothetical protein [Actinoplanes sp. NPDC051851]|uniref:hypothetical protein n=1 Tax=Actinoplanes sp. NPDC051851 TaxID=3154753 RepID=UPI00341AC1DE
MAGGASPGRRWSGFSEAFRRGQREILVLRLVRGVRRGSPGTWAPWVFFSVAPLVMAAALPVIVPALPFGLACPWRSIDWGLLSLLTMINFGVFAAASLAWNFGLKHGESIDNLLSTCAVRDLAMRPVHWAMSVPVQSIFPAAFAMVPLGYFVKGLMTGRQDVPYYADCLAAAWTMLIVGNDVWWLVIPPLIIVRIRDRDDLNLLWHDPARTPGIRTFAEGYGYSSAILIAGALVIVVPEVPWHPLVSEFVRWIYPTLLILSLWIGAMTQTLIYMLNRRKKLRVLRYLEVDQELLRPRPGLLRRAGRNTQELADSLTAYAVVAAAPNLPYGSAVVAQYAAAVVGSALGFFFQINPPR